MTKFLLLTTLLISSCLDTRKIKSYGPEIKKLGYFCAPYYEQDGKIFLGESILKGIHSNSFQHIRRGLIRDKNGIKLILLDEKYGNYRCAGQAKVKEVLPIENISSPSNFKIIQEVKEGIALATDGVNYYTVGTSEVRIESIIAEPASFKLIPLTDFAKDNKRVYVISKEPKKAYEWFKAADQSFDTIKFIDYVIIRQTKEGKSQIIKDYLKPSLKKIEDIRSQYASKDGFSIDIGYRPSHYFKDSQNVFYQTKKLREADPDTFIALQTDLGMDAKSLYVKYYQLNGRAGELIHINAEFAKDQNHLYDLKNREVVKNVEIKTFQILNEYYSKDQHHVYFGRHGNILTDADSKSFKIFSEFDNKGYARDKKNVYYRGQPINGADLNTFKIVKPEQGKSPHYAEDKAARYLYGKPISKKP